MLGPRKRSCTAKTADGFPCNAPPMRDEPFCFWHHPDHKSDAAEARRLGGLRRRREKTIEGAYDLHDGLDSADGISRLLDITSKDLLSMEPSIGRTNALLRVVREARALMETGNIAQSIADLEAALKDRSPEPSSPFDVDLPKIVPPEEPSLN